jgi:hypothetical protein
MNLYIMHNFALLAKVTLEEAKVSGEEHGGRR